MWPSTRRTASAATYTSWIQTTATLGLFLSLVVILVSATLGEDAFAGLGLAHSVPRLDRRCSAISVWIRMKMNESPAFAEDEGRGQGLQGAADRSLRQWKNAKIALLALFGLVVGQAVVWYTGQFYALFFLTSVLKVDGSRRPTS
jgi:hypothetical protein